MKQNVQGETGFALLRDNRSKSGLYFIVIFLSLFSFQRCSFAVSPYELDNPGLTADTWVLDRAGLLSEPQILSIRVMERELEEKNGTQLAVVTISKTDHHTPKQFATRLFNLWGIGEKDVNNGVLFLVVNDERRVEVETGNGARAWLSDSLVQKILLSQVIPAFKAGQKGKGICDGVRKLKSVLMKADYSNPPVEGYEPGDRTGLRSGTQRHSLERKAPPSAFAEVFDLFWSLPWWMKPLFPLFLLYLWVCRWLRNRPRICSGCSVEMFRLDEESDDQYLDAKQRTEEQLASVDYDVWVCPRCHSTKTEKYRAWFTSYSDCPSCGARTLSCRSVTLSASTQYSTGRGRRDYTCRHCHHSYSEYYTIPRKPKPSTSSSSSSYSSSSSFGGGSSSGGGSGASW